MYNRLVAAAPMLLGLAVVAPAARAQSAGTGPHSAFGVMAGANFANLSGSDADGFERRTGFVGGLTQTIQFTRMFAVRAELLYSQEGAKGTDASSGDVLKLKNEYVELPVLLRIGFPSSSGSVTPYIEGGATAGYSVRCKLEDETTGATVDCDDADLKKFDAGVAGGAGLRFGAGSHAVEIGGRFRQGLTDIFNGTHVKNRVISAFMGFAI